MIALVIGTKQEQSVPKLKAHNVVLLAPSQVLAVTMNAMMNPENKATLSPAINS